MSRMETPESSIRNVPLVFGDHFDPILILLAPLYALFPAPQTLLLAQAFLLVLPAGIICLWAYKSGLSPFWGLLLAFFYLGHPGIQGAVNCDFHEIAFAPLFLTAALYFLSRKNWRGYFISIVLLLLVKEEFALWAVAIGIFAVLLGKRFRVGGIAIILGIVYFVVLMKLAMPALNYPGVGYAYGNLYPGFENGFLSGIVNYASNPAAIGAILTQFPEKWWTMALYIAPLLLPLAFCAAAAALFLPAAATRILSSYAYLSYAGLYYNAVFAPLAAAVFIYFLDSPRKSRAGSAIQSKFDKINLSFPIWVISLAMSVNLLYGYNYSYILDPVYNWKSVDHPDTAQMADLIDQIPADASVSASYFLLPHLSQRDNLYVLPRIGDARFVIFDYCESIACNYWPVNAKIMPQIRDFLSASPLFKIKKETRFGIVFERTGDIDAAAKSEMAAFCRRTLEQAELQPIHRKYLLENCLM